MTEHYYTDIAIKYAEDILSGKIISCLAVKQACERFKKDLESITQKENPFTYDYEAAEEVCSFVESLVLPDTRKPISLLPWQIFCYCNLYGFVYKNNPKRRRFRMATIFVARKNGKTAGLLYGNCLYQFLTEQAAESYLISATNDQSEKSLKEITQIIKSNSELDSACNCWSNAITFDDSRLAFFSSETTALDGYRPNFACLDEFWNFQTNKPLTAMKYGSRARTNGLCLVITTASMGTDTPAYVEYTKAKHILEGKLKDESYFSLIYEYDEKDDWKDSSLLIKANPSLGGDFLKIENLISDLNSAIDTPSERPDYIAKTCNRFTFDNTSNWIDPTQWNQSETEIDFRQFKNSVCTAAIDLSSVRDFTVLSYCFCKDNNYYFKHRYYIPEETLKEKYKTDNALILDWVDKGIITATPGTVVDYEYLIEDLKKDSEYFQILEVAYDRWMSELLIQQLNEALPDLIFASYDQCTKNFYNPTKEFERLIYSGQIIDPNPVQKWMLGNCCVKVLPNGFYKPIKKYKSSTARIDSIITAIMCLDRLKFYQSQKQSKPLTLEQILSAF